MAQIKDVLLVEGKRETLEQCVVIHLFEEGTFYRAYQWSAWLCHRYIRNFKPTHRKLKQQDDSLIFVGFPISSLMNYFAVDFQQINVAEKQIDVILPLSLLGDSIEIANMENDYANWKLSVPMVESSKRKLENNLLQYQDIDKITTTDLLNEIACFPLEQKSLLECLAFLTQLKQKVLYIITKT